MSKKQNRHIGIDLSPFYKDDKFEILKVGTKIKIIENLPVSLKTKKGSVRIFRYKKSFIMAKCLSYEETKICEKQMIPNGPGGVKEDIFIIQEATMIFEILNNIEIYFDADRRIREFNIYETGKTITTRIDEYESKVGMAIELMEELRYI